MKPDPAITASNPATKSNSTFAPVVASITAGVMDAGAVVGVGVGVEVGVGAAEKVNVTSL
jgi:hypothetical protein